MTNDKFQMNRGNRRSINGGKKYRLSLVICHSFVIGILSFVIFLSGCAKTVVPLPSVGNQLTVTITMRGDVDASKYKYYMVFGSSNPVLPYPGTYFFGPGEEYDTNKMNVSYDLNYYYVNYFATWNDFILLKNNFYYITNGAFTSSASHTTYAPNYLDVRPTGDTSLSKKIVLTFYFSKLSTLPADLYFNFVCIDENGYLRDYLRSTDNNVSTNAGTTITDKTEPTDLATQPALDIISWGMSVQ